MRLLAWNNTPPKTFARINTLKTTAEEVLPRWRDEGIEYDFVSHDWTGENLIFELKSHPPLGGVASFQAGDFYVQDPSTLLAVRMLDPRPGETILDFCAAPGGKTTFIAQLTADRGKVIAHDNSPERIKLIEANCRRLGVTCVSATADRDAATSNRNFDKVLVDAPCSNTGVMRRRVDLRWRLQPEEIGRMQNAQLQILKQAARSVRPGGLLTYSTCSLEAEENAAVVQQFQSEVSGFALECERTLTPFMDGVDGAFVARLRRA